MATKVTESGGTHLGVDATFKTAPLGFYQMCVMLFEYRGQMVPIFFILMTCKREALYRSAFQGVTWYVTPSCVETVMSDYETALMNAVGDTFPDARPAGCWFHYSQACFRRVQKLGLVTAFGTKPTFRAWCSKVFALPLLPADRIERAWDTIKAANISGIGTAEKRAVRQFRAYVTSQWMVRVGPEALSVFGNSRRTNNDLESFNAWFVRLVKVHHPPITVWLDHINKVFEDTASEMERLDQGLAIRRAKRKKNVTNTRALRRLEGRLTSGELTEELFLGN